MKKQFKIYLDEISYGGDNIGRDLIITITPGTAPATELKKQLPSGKTASGLDLTVLKETTKEDTKQVTLMVNIVEKDKISDPGSGVKEITIDLKKEGPQTTTMEVVVDAKGGDKGKRATFILKFVAMLIMPVTVKGTVTVNANSQGSAKKGKDKNGNDATDESVAAADTHAKRYNGPTEFKAEYEIVIVDGKLDPTKSKVKFITVSYTEDGMKKVDSFTTNEIPITTVKFSGGDPKDIESFTCESKDWYPADGPGEGGLKERDLTGSVDLKNGKASYEASYTDKNTGARYTYKVDGVFKTAQPVPGPRLGGKIFSPPVPVE